jgi:hypothetical protein
MKAETSEKPFLPNSIDQLNQPKQDTKHLIIQHLRVQNMKTQQTRSMCTAILHWDQVLRKHFTWVDSAGFGVAHLRMLHVDLKAKLTFPHWGQVQSPSPPRAPVRKILYMRLQRKICNSGFEATHSVSSQKPKVTQQEPYYTKTTKYHSQRNWLFPSSGYSWVASHSRTQLPIALQDNIARCLRTSLTYTQQSLPSVRARFGPPAPRTSVWPQIDKFSIQEKSHIPWYKTPKV